MLLAGLKLLKLNLQGLLAVWLSTEVIRERYTAAAVLVHDLGSRQELLRGLRILRAVLLMVLVRLR